MVKIGRYNNLTIVKFVDFGLYLDGEELGEILLPKKEIPKGCKEGDKITVFVYRDSKDRVITTTNKPLATVNQAVYLKVVSVNDVGAFLDWGLPKELLVPYNEQKVRMKEGRSYLVYVYLDDKTSRIAASSKLNKFIHKSSKYFLDGQEVDLLITDKTELGYSVIINHSFWGMIYDNEIFQKVKKGMNLKGYIKKLREDGKIDCCLQKLGYDKVTDLSERILLKLKKNDGFLKVSDKSSPGEIYKLFEASKKSFKKAIGALYKQKIIMIEKNGIRLVSK